MVSLGLNWGVSSWGLSGDLVFNIVVVKGVSDWRASTWGLLLGDFGIAFRVAILVSIWVVSTRDLVLDLVFDVVAAAVASIIWMLWREPECDLVANELLMISFEGSEDDISRSSELIEVCLHLSEFPVFCVKVIFWFRVVRSRGDCLSALFTGEGESGSSREPERLSVLLLLGVESVC